MLRPALRLVPLTLLLAATGVHAGYDSSVPRDYVPSLQAGTAENYFAEMNTGCFDEQYAPLKAKLEPGRSYIVLHNRLPSMPLDLRTPNGFRKSVEDAGILNVPKLDIGHVMLGWHCEIGGTLFE